MGQNVIGPGGVLMSPSCLLFAPAQVPGHMATGGGVPVPVSITVMKFFLSVFIFCACQHFRSPAWPRKAPAMSSKDGKAIERSAKRRRTDAVVPAENPAVDTSELGSCSSGSNVQEARKPVEMSMQDIRDDITQILMVERKQFEKDINASFTSLYENLQSIFKTQQESRKARHSVYSQMFWPLYQQWQEEVERAKDQEENLAKAKDLCEHHKTFIGGHQSEVEKEISKAQDRVIMKTQEQDVSVVETYLQSLVLDSSEETI
ncbi:synaptonemal complex protein 3-like isoform X2 [Meriones unguiculatus]|uniref:synaptonemal complex protein 3-like isoform X3 n=1 Tax=Meriones unguiculatus TaxID=10047 RepID=UPI00293EC983|nr:synaptonemal complex protein 3-like isoform X3 [Meriones unguiculatus]XP_060232664.1 synaptonemal complex protein 3-like isoform X2 [Meriones unguiculatus]